MPSYALRTPLSALAALLLTATACPADPSPPGDTEDATSTSSDTSTGPGTTTDDPGSTSVGQTSEQTSEQTSGTTTNADGSSSEDTGPGPGPGVEAACEAYCDNLELCFPEEPPPEDCVDFCIEEASETKDEACSAAIAELFACFGSLTCEQLEGEEEVCVEEENAVTEICDGQECIGGIGVGEEECSYTLSCPKLEQEMNCDTQTCTCVENGVEIGSCDAMGVCEDIEELANYVDICCGFE